MSIGLRKLSAIMFTDIVGYTSMAQENEMSTLELLEEHRQVMRSVLPSYQGKEIKTIGDGFLIEFESVLEAARCAVEIQRRFREINSKKEEGKQIWLRIGLHLGDVMQKEGDIAGDAVNVASRLVGQAPPGGVCITQQVYDQVRNKLDLRINDMGMQKLKHVKEPMQLYAIGLGPVRKEKVDSGARTRVAVLPMTNISPDPTDEYFAEGMTEEIISTISRIEGLGVIARTSIMKYKSQHKGVSEIRNELNVDAVLEGSVRKAGSRLRITAQLIDSRTEEHLWSQDYDRELTDVFRIQSDIAGRIADALKLKMLKGAEEHLKARTTESFDAYTEYLKGRFFWNKRTESDLRNAIRMFSRSLKSDSAYAPSLCGIADSYAMLALLEIVPPKEAFPRAKRAAESALELDKSLADAHTSLGLVMFQYEWNWRRAESEFTEALKLNPNYPLAHHFYADFLKAMGRFDEALREIRAAQQLDPLSLSINTGVGHVLYLSGQYDKSLEQYRRTVELEPNFVQARLWYGRPLLQKGRYKEAISELKEALTLSGRSTIALAMLGHCYASAGREKETDKIITELSKRARKMYVAPYWMAVVYNGTRDVDKTLYWLRKALVEKSSWLVWLGVEPRFQWLRNDARFVRILEKVGLK